MKIRLFRRTPDELSELCAYLDSIHILPSNIGDIRRRLLKPYDCQWNAWVRDETAAREGKFPMNQGASMRQMAADTEEINAERAASKRIFEQNMDLLVQLRDAEDRLRVLRKAGRTSIEENTELRNHLNDCIKRLRELEDPHTALELERDNYRSRAQELARQLDAVKIERDAAEKREDVAEDLIKALRRDLDAAQARVNELQKGSEKGTLYQPFAYPFDVTVEAEFARWMNANADGIFGSNQAVRLWHTAISGELRGRIWTCIWLVLRHLHAIGWGSAVRPAQDLILLPEDVSVRKDLVERALNSALGRSGYATYWRSLSEEQHAYIFTIFVRILDFLPKLDTSNPSIPAGASAPGDRNSSEEPVSRMSTSENAQVSTASEDAEQSPVPRSPAGQSGQG